MPLLHVRITENNQNINMSRSLHSQNFTLRRCIITRNPSLLTSATAYLNGEATQVFPTYDKDLLGGIIVDFSFFTGYEIMSNFTSNDLMVPFSNMTANIDERFSQNFSSENINLAFNVKCFDFDRKATVEFVSETTATTSGAIHYIDFIFEFDSLAESDTY